MFDVSYIPGNFSPFHRGHMALVLLASKETTGRVKIVMSSRGRGEISKDVKSTFIDQCLRPILPDNVDLIITDKSPIRVVYEELDKIDKDAEDTCKKCAIYASLEDIDGAWNDENLQKYLPKLLNEARLSKRTLPREATSSASATKVRGSLRTVNRPAFDNLMPDEMDKDLAWTILNQQNR